MGLRTVGRGMKSVKDSLFSTDMIDERGTDAATRKTIKGIFPRTGAAAVEGVGGVLHRLYARVMGDKLVNPSDVPGQINKNIQSGVEKQGVTPQVAEPLANDNTANVSRELEKSPKRLTLGSIKRHIKSTVTGVWVAQKIAASKSLGAEKVKVLGGYLKDKYSLTELSARAGAHNLIASIKSGGPIPAKARGFKNFIHDSWGNLFGKGSEAIKGIYHSDGTLKPDVAEAMLTGKTKKTKGLTKKKVDLLES